MKSALLLAVALALPAEAARKLHHRAAAVRPEDDPRKKGDSRAFAKARIAFEGLPDGEAVADGDVPFTVRVTGYALGNGPHLHLIVDNEPAVQLDADGAWVLHGLARGPHFVRAVLCRPWHEVVKAPHAFASSRLWVGERLEGKTGKAAEDSAWPDPRKPLLTTVLPIGGGRRSFEVRTPGGEPVSPAQDPERPVLDFYVSGTKLARRGAKVRVVLDRRELPLVTDWKPQPLRRARAGVHRLTVDLLDRFGQKVHNAVNRTDRSFIAR